MFRFCFNMWLTPLKPLNEKPNCFNSAFISVTTEPKQNAEVFDRCTRTSQLVICTCFASQDLILIILPFQLGVSARTQRGPAGAPVTCNSHWFSCKKSTVSFKSKHRNVNNSKKHVMENFSEDTGNISNTIYSQFNKVYVPPKMLGNVSHIPVLMTLDQTINYNEAIEI